MQGHLRASRAIIGVGVALYLALFVSVLVRFIDAAVDLHSGAWVVFDDAGAGLSEAMVSALWDQWGWLWCAAWVWWPIAMGVLVVALRRAVPGSELGVGHAVLCCVVPVLTSALSVELFRRIRDTLATTLHDDPLPTRIAKLAAIAPWSPVFSPVVLVAILVAVGRSQSPTTFDRAVVLAALLLPLAVPVGLRAAQFALLLRALTVLGERQTVDAVRAQHTAPVAG